MHLGPSDTRRFLGGGRSSPAEGGGNGFSSRGAVLQLLLVAGSVGSATGQRRRHPIGQTPFTPEILCCRGGRRVRQREPRVGALPLLIQACSVLVPRKSLQLLGLRLWSEWVVSGEWNAYAVIGVLRGCRYVIVGGGNAAGYAARTFVEHGMADGRLCIVSKEVG